MRVRLGSVSGRGVVLGMRMEWYLRDGGVESVPNVVFTGLVSEEEKRALCDLTEVAIVSERRGNGVESECAGGDCDGNVGCLDANGLRGVKA